MTYPPVLSKRDFVLRYAAGEFGNGSPTWLTCDEFLRWGCKEFGTGPSHGLFHLRNGYRPGGVTYYRQHWSQAVARWIEQVQLKDWYVSQQVPREIETRLLIQGEVQQAEPGRCGLDLYYSRTNGLAMREGLATSPEWCHGILASLLLREYLCPNSYDWLLELLRRYPGHVVEFSTYARRWGTLPNFNSVFWEVRYY